MCLFQTGCLASLTYNADGINVSKVGSTLTELYLSHTGLYRLLQDSQTYVIFLHRIRLLVCLIEKTVYCKARTDSLRKL